MDGYGCGLPEHIGERSGANAGGNKVRVGHERIVRRHVHAQGEGTARERPPDAPEADHPQPHVRETAEPAGCFVVPLPRSHAPVELDHPAHEREQERERVIGHLVHAVVGDVAHEDAARGRGLDVHVIEPHARRRDHAERRQSVDVRRRDGLEGQEGDDVVPAERRCRRLDDDLVVRQHLARLLERERRVAEDARHGLSGPE